MSNLTAAPALSQRLKTETSSLHEHMHALMEQAQPFASRENYARFVAAQYVFQRDIDHLFADTQLQQAVSDLDSRGRMQASRDDLADLGSPLPACGEVATAQVQMPAALGWLYVSEGSTLGAVFLFKQAQEALGLTADFGARNLAAYPAGRAAAWRQFVASLDSEGIAPEQHQAVLDGARAAYRRFGQLLQQYFQLA
jgi:heme oxygenase